jgi:hypothetical protein
VDGAGVEVHMKSFLNDPKVDGTIFESLREPALFSQAQMVLRAVQWPNGADLAPDAMYDVIREAGQWIVECDLT